MCRPVAERHRLCKMNYIFSGEDEAMATEAAAKSMNQAGEECPHKMHTNVAPQLTEFARNLDL
jgi:hypothetical protein